MNYSVMGGPEIIKVSQGSEGNSTGRCAEKAASEAHSHGREKLLKPRKMKKYFVLILGKADPLRKRGIFVMFQMEMNFKHH